MPPHGGGREFNMNEVNKKTPVHNIILESRKKLSVSGVTEVDYFDETKVSLYTELGQVTVQGKNLHVNDISVASGEMNIDGDIWSIAYGDKDLKSPLSVLGKLFR